MLWIINIISFIKSSCKSNKQQNPPDNTTMPDKCIKGKIYSEQNELIEAFQDQLNEFILPKRLKLAFLHKHYEIRQNKRSAAS